MPKATCLLLSVTQLAGAPCLCALERVIPPTGHVVAQPTYQLAAVGRVTVRGASGATAATRPSATSAAKGP